MFATPACRMWQKSGPTDKVLTSRQLTLRGADALQRGHWEEAESHFENAIRFCPVDERSRAGHAEALWQRGAYDLAIQQMEESVRLSAGNPDLQVRLGEMRLAQGDRDGALVCVERALREQRNLATAWALQGDIQHARGDVDGALASYHRALHCQAHYPRVEIAVAEIYRAQNRPQRALSTLEALADQYPPTQIPGEVYFLQGLAQKALRRYDDAVGSLAAAAQRADAPELVFVELSDCQMLRGDLTAARQSAAEGGRRFPQSEQFPRLLAKLEKDEQRVAAIQPASATR